MKAMFDQQQRFVDLQDNASGFGDSDSWLAGDSTDSPTLHRNPQSFGGATAAPRNVDRDLYKDLVEIVPLVQSLIDQKASSSFKRRGSMIYTKTPSRESLSRKIPDLKGRNVSQSIPPRKKRDNGEKESKSGGNNLEAESFPNFSSRALTPDDKEELDLLKEQVENLQRKLLEKEESSNLAEALKNEVSSVHTEFDALRIQNSEKDSLIKSTQRQLADAMIKLADKQAAFEKIQWEAMTSNKKVEKLQEELSSVQGEISSFMLLFDGLLKSDSGYRAEDYDVSPCDTDNLPNIDDLDDAETQQMEEARKAYVAAVAIAKEKRDDKSVAAAAEARLLLQSYVLRKSSAEAP